jgi:FtsP/CotA-like multicopper oxidase with cupredoxin domain
MNKQKPTFKLNKLAAAVMTATATFAAMQAAHAGPGQVPATSYTLPNYLNPLGTVVAGNRPTYYANSPLGYRVDPVTNGLVWTGAPLRKFVNTLPGLTSAGMNEIGEYLPVAVKDTTSYANSDYYEIAIVEYSEQVHSDLPKPTTFRGYVQIDRGLTNTSGGANAALWTQYSAYVAGLPAAQAAYTPAFNAYNGYLALQNGLVAAQTTYATAFTNYSNLVTGLPGQQGIYGPLFTTYQSNLTAYNALVTGLPAAQASYNSAVSLYNNALTQNSALNAALPGVQTDYAIAAAADAAYQALVTGMPAAQTAYTAAMVPVNAYQALQAALPATQVAYTVALQPLVAYNEQVAQLPFVQTAWNQAAQTFQNAVVAAAADCATIVSLGGSAASCVYPSPAAVALPAGYAFGVSPGPGLPPPIVMANPAPAAPAVPTGYVDNGSGVLSVVGPVPTVPTVPVGYVVDATGTLSIGLTAPATAVVPVGFTGTTTLGIAAAVAPTVPAGYTVGATGLLSVTGPAPTAPAIPAGYADLTNSGTLTVAANQAAVIPAGYVDTGLAAGLAASGTLAVATVVAAPVIPANYVDTGLAAGGAASGTLAVSMARPAGAGAASPGSNGVNLTALLGYPVRVALENADHSFVPDLVADPSGNTPVLVPAYAYDKPHYLGPVIVGTAGTPVRVKYDNLMPVGRATVTKDAAGNITNVVRNGDLFLPFDTTLIGGGAAAIDPANPVSPTEMYMQNRAELHLHGGVTPWISDGTPHQWTVPVGETAASPSLKKGVSLQNVPDMPDPGPGAGTLYWTNAQSARLMFYHDHTVAQTRLNVFAGMAAGYVLTDATEQGLIASGTLPGIGIPLVIEDKTFVPADVNATTDSKGAAVPGQDAKWRTDAWGKPGDLWYPHVIEPNQDPNSAATSFTSPVGRWDYGYWFWPVFPITMALPTGDYGNVTTTPEGYMDTPTVNGTAYPKLSVPASTVRFRILNASNDRMMNLQLYVADSTQHGVAPAAPAGVVLGAPAANTEVKMVPAIQAGLPDCAIDQYDQLVQPLKPVVAGPAGAPLSGPGSCWPINWPSDGRAGGVPDPSTAGPTMWHIGSEGGFLPGVAAEPPVPVNYDYNRRSVTVLNVSQNNDPTQACAAANNGAGACHGLYVGPAERADVVVDFSAYAGKTLILYNDAPAPNPGVDPRIDYFTGDPDNTLNGAAPTTLAGYGPNTRTIMQINVGPAIGAAPLNVVALDAALKTAYAASQPKPIVAEAAYDRAFGTAFAPAGDQTARIYTGSRTQPTVTWVDGITGAAHTYCMQAAASATTAPTTLVPLAANCDGPILNKTIQELFDNYGRMNATLGTEIPLTSATTQTTLPFGYIDPTTETLPAGETQIWKVTHNGVDAHPVHFHLLNVQLINRVGWDGTLKAPEQGELGWK